MMRGRAVREFRAQLAAFEAADGEMVRVYVRGRRNLRAAVSYAGYPSLGRDTVTLFGTDGLPRGTVRLVDIAHIQRVFTKAPKTSRWYTPAGPEPGPKPKPAPPAPEPVPVADAAAEVITPVAAEVPRSRVIRAELELDISPALRQVEFLREKVQEALDRRLDDDDVS